MSRVDAGIVLWLQKVADHLLLQQGNLVYERAAESKISPKRVFFVEFCHCLVDKNLGAGSENPCEDFNHVIKPTGALRSFDPVTLQQLEALLLDSPATHVFN